jgi:HPr kinase/phosphorylase
MPDVMRVHGTTVSLNGKALLIRAAPGFGKSDLALQLMETSGHGLTGDVIDAKIVADDQTEIYLNDDMLFARAPSAIVGKFEMRGYGILYLDHQQDVPLVLVIDLKAAVDIERMPETATASVTFFGVDLPRFDIDPTKASASARLRTLWALATGALAGGDRGA